MGTELRKIESTAPTRMDLAGGTVDIWPLYLFLRNPTTINLGIDLIAEARIEETEDGKITLSSGDQNAQHTLGWNELDTYQAPPQLEIHLKFLRHFTREKLAAGRHDTRLGLKLSTSAKSPAGAGLGGSSTLSIATIGALATWSRGEKPDPTVDGEKLIEIARDTETTIIQVPAGLQDYYGAMFGGLQSLRWRAGTHKRYWMDAKSLTELEQRLILFYSGQSRNSGINNWALFKAFIDRQGEVRRQFESIAEATLQLEEALRVRDWVAVGSAIAREWETRRGLAQGISTPEMEAAFHAAFDAGATAGKVCGAGGGGCFFVYVPDTDPALRKRIQEKVGSMPGIRQLPFRALSRGLNVQVSRA